jgi:hypothetical protein
MMPAFQPDHSTGALRRAGAGDAGWPRKGLDMTRLKRAALPAVIAASVLLGTSAARAVQNEIEKFTGFAINMNSGPGTATVDFTIERWSTPTERDQLLAIIKEHKDPTDPLLRALQKMPRVGYIRTPNTLAWDVRYAWESPLEDGGRRVVLGTDRPIGFREARNQARTMDYPFTIVEVRLGKDNRGQGKILAGTRIFIDKSNNLVLENYGQQPIRFNEIRKVN